MKNRLLRRGLVAAVAMMALLASGCAWIDDDPERVSTLPVNEPLDTVEQASVPEPEIYVVQEDDTLVSIAEAHGLTLAELLELNDVPQPALIEPGLELLLSAAPPVEAESSAARTTPPVVDPPAENRSWYERVVDRLPSLPEPLEPARPVLLALAIVAVTVVGVGLVAVVVPLFETIIRGGATGVAFGGSRLHAALEGIPRGSAGERAGGDRRWRDRLPSVSWPERLRFSRSAIAIRRPSVASRARAAMVPAPAGSRVLLPSPRASVAMPQGGSAEGGGGVVGRAASGVRAMTLATGRACRQAGAATLRGLGVLAAASVRLSGRGARAVGRLSTRGAAIPARRVAAYRERRERQQFRADVEATTASRMRLGLGTDNEAFLQRSVDESLDKGWRLEAAWCLQLMAEEADRRGERAVAELRRVRARELIREHAQYEEPLP